MKLHALFYFILLALHPDDFLSVHQIEYFAHYSEAEFSKVSEIPVIVEPLIEGKGLLKTFYGYAPYWVDTTALKNLDWSLITHVAYFSISINSDGSLGGIPNSARFLFLINYAHPRGVRVHITFTIFGNSSVSTFLNNATARQNAVSQIVSFVENYGIEGVNIDFEFVTSTVKDSFTRFIIDLNNALKTRASKRKDLFIAMPAVPEWYPGYDFTSLANNSDGLFIMAYDFHYSGSSEAGPVAPNVPSTLWGNYCVAKTIGSYKARCSSSKLILGMPYYGYRWPTSSGDLRASTTGSGSAVSSSTAMSEASTYGRLWDTYSLTPWYRYIVSSQWYQVWYDDTASIRIKLGMVVDSSLGGAGCWALSYDRGVFSSVIREVLLCNPPERHFVVKVIVSSLNVREGPGTSYPVMAVAPYGSKFVAFDYYGNWYKIYFPSASGYYYGWVYGGDGINYRYLEGSSGEKVAKCNASLLNVREGPGTAYSIITQISYGQTFVVDSIASGWARIYLPQLGDYTKGWISLNYAELMQNLEDYNPLSGTLLETYYQGNNLIPGDTFRLRLKIRNTAFSPFDSLTLLVASSDSSVYFHPDYWVDPEKAKPLGNFGLPNQTFYFDFILRAPELTALKSFQETFYLIRNGRVILGPINVSVTLGILENMKNGVEFAYDGGIIKVLNYSFDLNPDGIIEIYDVSGRRLVAGNLKKDRTFGPVKIGRGVYFVVLKSNNIILAKGKMVIF